jgi:DNA polymerase I
VLIAADYSQIELRIMAHLSGDAGLLRRVRARSRHPPGDGGRSVRRSSSPDLVTPDQRRAAKAINFGLIYGMSAFGLARQLGIDRGAAQNYVDRYFQRYPGVKRYMDDTRVDGARTGLHRDRVRPPPLPA